MHLHVSYTSTRSDYRSFIGATKKLLRIKPRQMKHNRIKPQWTKHQPLIANMDKMPMDKIPTVGRTYSTGILDVYMHTWWHTHMHVCTHTYIHSYIHTYIYIYTYIHIHTYTYIHTYVRTYIHIYNHFTLICYKQIAMFLECVVVSYICYVHIWTMPAKLVSLWNKAARQNLPYSAEELGLIIFYFFNKNYS